MLLRAFYSSDIFLINSHVPMIYYEPYYIKTFILPTSIKLLLLNVKNEARVTFVVIHVSVTVFSYN